jgi:hypothetical protein
VRCPVGVAVGCGETCGLAVVFVVACVGCASSPVGVVVRFGGLMVRRVRHGRGGDDL